MNASKILLQISCVTAILLTLSSCQPSNSPPTPTIDSNPAARETAPAPAPSLSPNPAQPEPSSEPRQAVPQRPQTAAAGKTVPIKLFHVDSQCTLVSEKVSVAADRPMEDAIAKILAHRETADFSVVGYRLDVKAGTATVDLRRAPGSARRFQSLSACEQTALFGSIQQTLVSNPQWKVREVEFTEQGKNLEF